MYTPEIIQLYQLCRLDVPGPLLAAVLFDELKNSIPCAAMTLLWRKVDSSIARGWYESEMDLNCGFVEPEMIDRLFSGAGPALLSRFDSADPVLEEMAGVLPGVRLVVKQKLDTLAAYLRHGENCIGAILLHRPSGAQFSMTEKAALVRWAPALASALTVEIDHGRVVTNEGNAGILLLDDGMNIQSACCRGRKLLDLANGPGRKAKPGDRDEGLGSLLRAHFCSMENAGEADFVLRNEWGNFQFRLHRLCESALHANSLTAVSVHLQEPIILSVFRGCNNLALTEKQTEICLLLTKGLSYEATAAELGIKPTTVIDHVRKIYDKVGVGSRSELVTTLLLGLKRREAMPSAKRRLNLATSMRCSIEYL